MKKPMPMMKKSGAKVAKNAMVAKTTAKGIKHAHGIKKGK